jgi:aspartyl-tRNA(Asn)/glutamyl-tRNA(Gln) amidotransferase subunit C
MSKLSREDILKLARLSRLKLSDEEIESLQAQLSEILTYVEQLNEVDVTGLEPTYQVTGLKNITRPDEVRDYQAKPADLLKNAPATIDNQFKVKRVL